MSRRPLVAVALLTAAAVTAVPAHAATKPKPKPIRGSYAVSLPPDVTTDAFSSTGAKNPTGAQCGLLTASTNSHPFKVPAAGKLKVVLDSPNPLPVGTPLGPDWDLHIIDADGSELDASTSTTSHEETNDKFKKSDHITIEVCNITGQPSATVTYTFTYA
jgi:hypothetical protein